MPMRRRITLTQFPYILPSRQSNTVFFSGGSNEPMDDSRQIVTFICLDLR